MSNMLDVVRKQVKALRFSLVSPEEIKKLSVAKIVTPELYDIDGFPVDGGLMDLRLGAIDPGIRCRTDGATMKDCPGYPGHIEMARPIMHIKYVPLIELCLRCFHHQSGKLMLPDEQLAKYSPAERAKKARDKRKCPFTGEPQEKVRLEKPSSFYIGKKRLFPNQIREILINIPDEELMKIGMNPKTCRPEWGIVSQLLVPSVNVRPSITLDTGERSEDDLTHKISDIVRANQRLWENLNAGAPEVIIEDLWDLLQYHVTTFFDNNVTRIPPARHRSGQPLKTITERIKGKEGRIRKNLAGKRVNFSGRTVLSPDPYLKVNEVGVPYEIAKTITVPESVTTANKESLQNLIRRGSEYPGANYVVRPDGRRKRITPELVDDLCTEIEPGYKVERHLQDGDIVLFNRHPSLHKQSIMGHKVRVLPGRTFRIHPATAFPYNADFDGDETNIHAPQTEEARSEAEILLNVNNNIISSKNTINLIGGVADAVTGTYVLGRQTFDKAEADQILFQTGIINEGKAKSLTGLDVFKKIIPADAKITMPTDLSGENTFGSEDGVMVRELDKQVGREATVEAIERSFTLGSSYLTRRGYTLSLRDLFVPDKVRAETEKLIADATKKTEKIIEQAQSGSLELIPGKDVQESREVKISQVLNEVRTNIGKVINENLSEDGNISHMMAAGGGGSTMNISQIACSVGQQSLWDKRISFGYTDRTLPFFEKGDLGPAAHGFIKSSFFDGLTPTEFFFGAMTGRDALMDTALRTPKSGYLFRRIVSALQDMRLEYDGTVRDASGQLIQLKYGGDGKDVAQLHKLGQAAPGEAVGVVTAQSFGEASTQMVLNVFHSAGVAELQVTSGLPRLIEIFDARKEPSTPSMDIYLDKDHNNEKDARIVAEKIREVKLEEIAQEMNIDFATKRIEIMLDSEALKHVHVGAGKIMERLQDKGFDVTGDDTVLKLKAAKDLDFKELYKLKQKLRSTIVSGVKGVVQVVVSHKGRDYIVRTAGSNLKDVLEIKGINPNKVFSNNLHEIAKVLGIEAARQAIVNEIGKVLEGQGLDINERHLDLVADAMTTSGLVRGVTRMGIISHKSSVFARAAFETPDKQFVHATIQGKKDELASVVENIMLNQPVPVGTGLPGLLVKVTGPLIDKELEAKRAKAAA